LHRFIAYFRRQELTMANCACDLGEYADGGGPSAPSFLPSGTFRATASVTACLVLALLIPSRASADPVSMAAVWAGNGHQYAVVAEEGITWDAAQMAASALSGGWHLATITSPQEQTFVSALLLPEIPGVEYWLGGWQNPPSTIPAGDNWGWITGESFGYTNWNNVSFHEPNDFYGPGSEQHLAILGANSIGPLGMWNDEAHLPFINGYVVESSSAVPEPGSVTLLMLGLGAVGAVRHRRR
jgi:hypothetical protein